MCCTPASTTARLAAENRLLPLVSPQWQSGQQLHLHPAGAGQDGIVLVQKLLNQDDETVGMVVGMLDRHFFQAEVAKLPVGRLAKSWYWTSARCCRPAGRHRTSDSEQPLNELQSTEVLERHDNYLQFRASSILDQEAKAVQLAHDGRLPFRVVVGIAERDFTRAYHDKATWPCWPGCLPPR
jgi:hypothetical protein